MRGKFITLEGGEGAGKTTLIKAVQAALVAKGLDVVVTREPGGTPGAEVLRDILLKGATDRWSPVTEALLMYAARVDHVERLIEPALSRGAWVISDRFADSTMAYQGYGGGVDPARIRAIHGAAIGDFKPDLTLILDLETSEGLARAGKRLVEAGSAEDRYERMERDFHDRLRNGFLEIAKADPLRCRVIDAAVDLDPRTGLERTVARGEDATRFERFDADFHARLRQAFLDIAAREPERCCVLDARSDADAVAAAALQAIETRLGAPA